MGLEIVILSEVSQTEKEKYHIISFISGVERVTGRKARGPQAAGGNKLQVAGVFSPSLLTKSVLLKANLFFFSQTLGL